MSAQRCFGWVLLLLVLSTQGLAQALPVAPQASKVGEVQFHSGSANLDGRAKAILDDLALLLQREPEAKARIVGFSYQLDAKPSLFGGILIGWAAQAALAAERAENAKTYVTREKGIDPERVEVSTGTEGRPRADLWVIRPSASGGTTPAGEAKPVPQVSQLSLLTQPGGVQVYLDEVFKGVSSEQEGTLRVEGIAPGEHRLRLTLPGYKEWKQQVTLTSSETLPLNAKLELAGPKPLAFEEVEEALKNGVSPKRMMTLVTQFGVDFALTDERERRLRDAGADTELLFLITKSKK